MTQWRTGNVQLCVGEHIVPLNINKMMKYPNQVFEDLGSIDLVNRILDSAFGINKKHMSYIEGKRSRMRIRHVYSKHPQLGI